MDIEFRRTGERRYAVIVRYADGRSREMSPAVGFDASMPHDLLHYGVERELGLNDGVFGQLAQGGHASFRPLSDPSRATRQAARDRRRTARQDARIARVGQAEAAKAEAAVYEYGEAWRKHVASARPAADANVARICVRLDELSARWRRLRVGESMTVSWPETPRRRPRASSQHG
jgi:hypothetical protein